MNTILYSLFLLAPFLSFAQPTPAPGGQTNQAESTRQKPGSGIRGLLVMWPIRPSSRIGESNSAPLTNATVTVQPEPGAEVGRQKTDAKGRFEFRLPPGRYTVKAVLGSGWRLGARQATVEVQLNQFTNIVVTCDTGIR